MATVELGEDVDITIRQGSSFYLPFQQTEDDETTVIPFPEETTGRAQIRAGDLLLADFTVLVFPSLGMAVISLTDEETAAVTRGGRYDLFVDYPDGSAEMLIRGKVTLQKRVTTE